MDKELEKRFKKDIADYQKIAGGWESKETIEGRLAAWREEQKLAQRAMVAERFLTPRKPLTEEQLAKYVEGASEFFGIDISEIWKWFGRKKKN